MLDIKAIRQDPDAVVAALAKRGLQFDLEQFASLDARRKQADVRAQGLLAERKAASKKIGELVSSGSSVEDAKAQVDEVLARLASDLEAATAEADGVQTEIDALLMETPNLPDSRVPVGVSEEDNVEVLKWGEPTVFPFDPKDHVDLGEALSQMDFETAGKIAGARFSMLAGDLARLHRALTQFMLDTHTQVFSANHLCPVHPCSFSPAGFRTKKRFSKFCGTECCGQGPVDGVDATIERQLSDADGFVKIIFRDHLKRAEQR